MEIKNENVFLILLFIVAMVLVGIMLIMMS